jgi:hypothetical protein
VFFFRSRLSKSDCSTFGCQCCDQHTRGVEKNAKSFLLIYPCLFDFPSEFSSIEVSSDLSEKHDQARLNLQPTVVRNSSECLPISPPFGGFRFFSALSGPTRSTSGKFHTGPFGGQTGVTRRGGGGGGGVLQKLHRCQKEAKGCRSVLG